MRDVYAAMFELGRRDEPVVGLLEAGAATVLRWVGDRYRMPAPEDVTAGSLQSGNDRADWATQTVEGDPRRLWELLWRQHDEHDQGLVWRIGVTIADTGSRPVATVRLALESVDLRIAPFRFDLGRPGVIPRLASAPGAILDGRPLQPTAVRLLSDHIDPFVEMLLDPDRRLPVVAISPARETGRALVDVDRVADRLIGLAHVVSLETMAATWELSDRVTTVFSVYQGAVRTYWPGLTLEDDPYRHPLWLPDRVRLFESGPTPVAARLERLLTDVALARVPVESLGRHLRAARDARTVARLAEMQEQLATPVRGEPDEAWLAELDDALGQIGTVTAANQALHDENESLRDEVERLQRSFADYAAALRTSGVDARQEPGSDQPIDSVLGATRRAAESCPHLYFLDEAFDGAGRSGYPQPERVYDALLAVESVARGWAENTLGTGFPQAFERLGYEYQDNVGMASAQWPGEYARQYRGRQYMLGPHLGLGRGTSADNIARIYWFLDEERKLFVVGHVGRHLRYPGS
jgi:hypothetical protein